MTKPPSIGALRKHITLMKPIHTRDDLGGTVITYEIVSTAWGACLARTPQKKTSRDQQETTGGYDVILRWRPDIMPGWRLKISAFTLHVLSTRILDPKERFLICHTEQVSGGQVSGDQVSGDQVSGIRCQD